MEDYLKETNKYVEDEIMKLITGIKTPNGSDYSEETLKMSLEDLENQADNNPYGDTIERYDIERENRLK